MFCYKNYFICYKSCMKKTAIIFDHDGTLVDSIHGVVVATNMTLKKYGFDEQTREEIEYGMGFPTFERFRYHSASDDNELIAEMSSVFYTLMHSHGIEHLKIYPGIQNMLDALTESGFSMGMVTNNQGMFVRKAAAHLHYAYDLEIILGEENVKKVKPAPDGILQACAGLAAEPENCWYIGDAVSDHEAAKAAGLKSGLVTWGAHPEDKLKACRPDALFSKPEELVKYFIR